MVSPFSASFAVGTASSSLLTVIMLVEVPKWFTWASKRLYFPERPGSSDMPSSFDRSPAPLHNASWSNFPAHSICLFCYTRRHCEIGQIWKELWFWWRLNSRCSSLEVRWLFIIFLNLMMYILANILQSTLRKDHNFCTKMHARLYPFHCHPHSPCIGMGNHITHQLYTALPEQK